MEENNEKRNDGKIIERDIDKEMRTAYIDYAMSVIVSRALPDVRDGLKPVHRRILYSMYEDGITSDKPYRKCANTVGSVLGRYHPHGDASVYDAMVRLAQDFTQRYTLIDGHGNFGSIDGDPAAAMRYTEARMAKIAETMLTDIEKNTVDFMPNYDDRLQEPTVLPAKIPALLVNGSSGIAVGMATNIPPHNLTEVIDGIIKIIDEDNVTDEQLMEIIKGPDFPTEGVILGLEGISNNDIASKQLLNHRSSLVDNKLINENNYNLSMMTEWEGYLLVLAGYKIYLADIRQIFSGTMGYEYEWYLWDFSADKICLLKEYQGTLYMGSEDGFIFVLKGTNDNGKTIISYWTTPFDSFGYGNLNKTTNKRGGIAKIKTMPNGIIKVSEITNKKTENKFITQYSAVGFDFNNIDFSNFAFTTKNNSYVVYKIKEKKFIEISLKFYSDELDKPFGIYSAIIEAFVGAYVKK